MKTTIVTKNTCDLPVEIVERHGIEIIPMHLQLGREMLIKGFNITEEEFHQRPDAKIPVPQITSELGSHPGVGALCFTGITKRE